MPLNPFFELFQQNEEQDLIDDIMAESISITGFRIFYLPRTHVYLDTILGEDAQSLFQKTYEMEAHLENILKFGDNMDFIGMTGLEIRDTAIFSIARKTFSERTFGSGLSRPKEGDLIYFPLGKHNNLYQITKTEDEDPFYQVGDLYVWKIHISMFEYSDEKLRTGVPQIDSIENRYVSHFNVTLSPGAGNYSTNETVYQGSSLETATFRAEVLSWSSATNILKVKFPVGNATPGTNLIGNTSGTSRNLVSDTSEFPNEDMEPISDNKTIDEEGDDLLTFDPDNPFGGGI